MAMAAETTTANSNDKPMSQPDQTPARAIHWDLEARQSCWRTVIADLEDEWDADSDDGSDDQAAAPGLSGGVCPNGLGGMVDGGVSSTGARETVAGYGAAPSSGKNGPGGVAGGGMSSMGAGETDTGGGAAPSFGKNGLGGVAGGGMSSMGAGETVAGGGAAPSFGTDGLGGIMAGGMSSMGARETVAGGGAAPSFGTDGLGGKTAGGMSWMGAGETVAGGGAAPSFGKKGLGGMAGMPWMGARENVAGGGAAPSFGTDGLGEKTAGGMLLMGARETVAGVGAAPSFGTMAEGAASPTGTANFLGAPSMQSSPRLWGAYWDGAGRAPTLREWIAKMSGLIGCTLENDDLNIVSSNSGDVKPTKVILRRKYLEASVQILHSLVGKIIRCHSGATTSNGSQEDVCVNPSLITLDNVMLSRLTLANGDKISADFVESGDSTNCIKQNADDNIRKKYLAMDALGRLAYEAFTLGEGPGIEEFDPGGKGDNDLLAGALRLSDGEGDVAAPLDRTAAEDDEIRVLLRKTARTMTSEPAAGHRGGIISAMRDALVPFPLCRLVADLLVDDASAVFGRSAHSFATFLDVLGDLKQMVNDPDVFLHGSDPDRWKLAFGQKLYGRDTQTRMMMDAAERMSMRRDDPIFIGLNGFSGRRKEVIMVSGHSGSGKSQLVRMGGKLLEERGWRFLKCKFDRVARPEPLSILASAFDEYFGCFATCPVYGTNGLGDNHGMNGDSDDNSRPLSPSFNSKRNSYEFQMIRQRLKTIISPEVLGIAAQHIPSLRVVAENVPPLSKGIQVNETMILTLFGQLLQVLSSKQTPVLFFVDDLQWADPLSLALLASLVKGAHLDLSLLSSDVALNDSKQSNKQEEQDVNVMFVGSYRSNEINEDHPLTKVLNKFQSDSSINLTDISLSGFTIDTLNLMLSESLSMPIRRVRSLSESVIQKTDGQPLHVIEFIQALTMDNLLTHSFDRGWEWDADSIDIFPITESVAELLSFKLRRLPRDILLGLQIVSVFGSQIDHQVLRFVADYDAEESVSLFEALRVATSEGLVEQTSSLVSFAHDLIQKATIDSISKAALVPLLRKLIMSLIKNSSAVNEHDSVLYVVVDLINRIGSDGTSSLKERTLFADLNARAGSKAIKVPDFDGASKYAENGISFLNENPWDTQYDLSLCLHETAVVSHFSSIECKRDRLTKQINAVIEHAKDFSDQFKTHCVRIKLLSMTDLSKAIEESLHVLERLGEPQDLTGIDLNRCRHELASLKEQFAGDRKEKFLSSNRLLDRNKVRAMKVLSSLAVYYHMKKSFLGPYISCQMIKMTIEHGHCEHSVFGAAAFASATVIFMRDIEEGSAWGQTALSLMNMYDKEVLIPSIHGTLYGTVFLWKEPIQATLEPLALGIRLSFAMGNVQFAMANTIYYILWSFNCGKHIRTLTTEVEALARQHGNHFGNDPSSELVYSPLLQFHLTPLYNVLRKLEGDEDRSSKPDEVVSFPLDKVRFLRNDDILKVALETDQPSYFHYLLSCEITLSFMFRDMDNAQKLNNLYHEHLLTKDALTFLTIFGFFHEALINFHFTRLTGDEHCRRRAENALARIKEFSTHSEWNFKNKLLLLKAEWHYTRRELDQAASCYEASIEAAREHKFIKEEAIACELAGIFFSQSGHLFKAKSYYLRSVECLKKWGALAVVKRVESSMHSIIGADLFHPSPTDQTLLVASQFPSEASSSKKRQSRD